MRSPILRSSRREGVLPKSRAVTHALEVEHLVSLGLHKNSPAFQFQRRDNRHDEVGVVALRQLARVQRAEWTDQNARNRHCALRR